MVEPHQIRVISDPETLRLIADPLRLRLLELLRRSPRTVTELAEVLELPRTNLYYHVRLLAEHDLIVVDDTREVSGITEKRYRAAAYRLSVRKALLGTGDHSQTPLDVYLSFVLDEVAGEIRRAVDAGLIEFEGVDEDQIAPNRLMLGRSWFHFSHDDVIRFGSALDMLFAQFEPQRAFEPSEPEQVGPPPAPPGAALYEFLSAFYPVVPPGNRDHD